MSQSYDPYGTCLDGCNHDLAPGVLVSDLLAGDGPRPALELVFGLPAVRPAAGDVPASAESAA